MEIDERLLKRARERGILPPGQDRQLQDLAAEMTAEDHDTVEERFRIVKDFNDVFISIGVVLLGYAARRLVSELVV
jgi:hypothetical protein